MEEKIELKGVMNKSKDAEVICITKIVTVDDEEQIHLDVDALRMVLMDEDIADLPVAIYSVVGPSRTGKSFLLNLMMRYKNRSQIAESDLEDIDKEELKSVFPWRGGADALTQGIYMLKRPFPFTDRTGRQAVLFFMDTQGFFDMDTAEQEHRTLGALSFLMSSKQIFNVKSLIESTHVDHIVKFAKLAEKIREKKKKCSPFQQQSLIFTVRDWEMKDFQIGFVGGKKYLNKRIEGKTKRAVEHHLKRNCLKRTFGEILCCLLPPPESKIRKMGQKDEACLIKEIGQDFLEKAEELFQELLAPHQVILKEINGKTVSCRQLYDNLDAHAPTINSEKGIEDNTQHFLEVDTITEMNHLIQEYGKTFMQNLWNQLCTEERNEQSHQTLFESMHKEMMEVFDSAPKPDVPQLVYKFRQVLDGLLKRIYGAYENGFKAEDLYAEAMLDFKENLTKITPEHTLMYKKYIKEATEKLESKAADLKNKIHEKIADQSIEYFLKEGKQFIEYTDKMQTKKIMKRAAIGLGATAAAASAVCPPLIIFGPLLTTVMGIVSCGVAAAAATASVTTTAVGIAVGIDDHEIQIASSVFRESAEGNVDVDEKITKGYTTKFKAEVVLALKFGKVRFVI